MTYTESILVKLLEYGKLSPYKTYESIAGVLGLEFYSDQDSQATIFTICSETFVLDINSSSCSLIFVDESKTAEFSVVNAYLNAYMNNPLIFYYLFKFFVNSFDFNQTTRNAPLDDSIMVQRDLSEHKTFCACVISGNYCFKSKIGRIPHGYNIFTHRDETGLYNPATCTNVKDLSSLQISNNLSEYFKMNEYTANTVKTLPPSPHYHYSTNRVRVTSMDVYVDEERCRIASFIFRKGGRLEDAVGVAERMKK